MNDMTAVIIPKSDQINADDLIAGPMTITITGVKVQGGQEQPVAVSFEGNKKVFRPCKSMCRVMVNAWGPDANKYVGKSLTLYRDPAVTWGAMAVGGIRISHMSEIKSRMVLALTEKKGSRKPFIVEPLVAQRAEAPLPADPPAEDKITAGVNALVARIDAAADVADLQGITGAADVTKQRAWLDKNRPDLAAKITDAVTARLADFDAPADDFPGTASNRDGTERE